MTTLTSMIVNLQAIAAGTAEERHACAPGPGEWYLETAYFVPSTTAAIDATNTATIAIKAGAGGTSLGTLTNAAVAFTKGTIREFSLSGGTSREFTGGAGTDCVEVAVSHAASGSVVDGSVVLGWRKMARDSA